MFKARAMVPVMATAEATLMVADTATAIVTVRVVTATAIVTARVVTATAIATVRVVTVTAIATVRVVTVMGVVIVIVTDVVMGAGAAASIGKGTLGSRIRVRIAVEGWLACVA